MKEPRKYPTDEESKPMTANEPEAVYGTVSRTSRMPMYHGAADNVDKDVPEYMMSEEAYRYFHPEEKLESLSDIEVRVVPLKEMLKHGMTLEESERRLTEKICDFYRDKA